MVDVANFNGQTWLDSAGNFHSEALHVVERYTRDRRRHHDVRGDHRGPEGVYQALEISVPLHLRREPNVRLLEYECHAYTEDAAEEQSK